MSKYDKMVELRKKAHVERKERVERAIRRMVNNGEPITIASVSKKADVSTSFIRKHEDVRQLVEYNRSTKNTATRQTKAKTSAKAKLDSTIKELSALRKENDDLKKEISQLLKKLEKIDRLQTENKKWRDMYDALLSSMDDSASEYNRIQQNLNKMKS